MASINWTDERDPTDGGAVRALINDAYSQGARDTLERVLRFDPGTGRAWDAYEPPVVRDFRDADGALRHLLGADLPKGERR